MKKLTRLFSIFFAIICLIAMLSYVTPNGRQRLSAVNSNLARTGFSLWQYFWLAMVFACISLVTYISLTKHYRKKYNIDDNEDEK